MAEQKKRKNKQGATLAPASASYAWLTKPDEGHKFSDGKFKVTMVYDDFDDMNLARFQGKTLNIKDACEALARAEWGADFDLAQLRMPYKTAEEQTKEQYEGKVTLTAKSKYKPNLFDSKRKPLAAKTIIMSGDLIAAIIDLLPYESTEKVRENGKMVTVTTYGISAALGPVQLIEKRAGSNGGPEGFDEHDGYDTPDDDGDDDRDSGDRGHDNNDDNGGDY